MCHLHNEFIYQFVECPNCKSNVCLDNQGSESISNHNFCKFCGILFVSSAKLARTSQNNNKTIEGYTRFDRYLQSYKNEERGNLVYNIIKKNQIGAELLMNV